MISNPIIPMIVLVPLIAILIVIQFFGKQSVAVKIRRIVCLLCILLINFKWIIPGNGQDLKVNPADTYVLIVMDDTLSMLANDYQGDGEIRMDGAKKDCEQIIDAFPGCKYGIMSFNNTANVLSPFMDNADYAKTVTASVTPIGPIYAKGSSMTICKDTMLQMLKSLYKQKGKKAYVFFLGDGENNTEEKMASFSELKQYTQDGAVLGYGTAKGGEMYHQGLFDDKPSVVEDRDTFKPAISKIDEKSLKKLAGDLGISYQNQNGGDSLEAILKPMTENLNFGEVHDAQDVDWDQETKEDVPVYFIFVAILMVILAYETVRTIVRKE